MYKLLLLIAVATAFVSCRESTSPISENKNNSGAIDSIKLIFRDFVKAAEEPNPDRLMTHFTRSGDLRLVSGSTAVFTNWDSLRNFFQTLFRPLARQRVVLEEPVVQMLSEKYAVLSTAGNFTSTRKDSSTYGGRLVWTFIFTRDSADWKVVKAHECFKVN